MYDDESGVMEKKNKNKKNKTMSSSSSFSSNKNKRRLKVLLALKLLLVIAYLSLSFIYSDGNHEEEIEKMERMLRESTSEEKEWKEDLKEVMEYLEDGLSEDDGDASKTTTTTTTTTAAASIPIKPLANKCFPKLQHNEDPTWGRYADFDYKGDEEDRGNKEVQLFQKILEKVSGKEPEECIDTSTYQRETATTSSDGKHFLKGSCALVFPTGHLSVGGAGMQIEAHDWVIRLNGHNAPKKFSRDAKDMGSRTDVRAITAALVNIGLDHSITYAKNQENWLMFSTCSHRSPQPWCVKLNQKLKHKPVKSLRFIKGESHRGVVCLKKLTKETHGAKHKYDKTPTTGFSTLLYLTRQCDCVTVFGLCNTTNCGHALAWSGHSDRSGWKDPVHNFNIEHIAAAVIAKKLPDKVQLWVSHKGMRKESHKAFSAIAEKVKGVFSGVRDDDFS
jgi:cytoskeletal protein RodZ